ncbi:Serralysin C precursor [Roseibium album]|nr:Serralysin C precursor [Roseibium album]
MLRARALAIVRGSGTDSLLDSQGENITLSIVSGDVVGSTTSFGEIFRISVDGSGNVTVTQSQQIDHLPESLDTSNDNANIALSDGLVTLSATATVTDFDNDQATTTVSADLGSNISFDDDVPSVTANAVADAGITLVTQDADTIGVASDTDSASFASAFLAAVVPDYGADGAAASNPVVLSAWALAITGGNGTDSLLDSQGENITLSIVSGDVVGSTTSFGEIFRISVDGSGNVTVTQSQQIDHLPESLDTSNDNANIALSDGLVTLSATATVTDFDNDQATTTVSADLGSNISFDDDVPSVTANAVADAGITLVTQDADTIGVASDTDSASFASAFLAAVVPDYGADGAAASNPVVLSAWALAITGGNGTDSLLDSQGENITLSIVSGDVVGSTTSFGEIFRISVDGSGNVTVTQSQQIDHLPESLDTSNDNANIALSDGLVTLSATATVTDFDNDQATTTVSADLGSNISFDDDVPSVSVSVTATTAYLDESVGTDGSLEDENGNAAPDDEDGVTDPFAAKSFGTMIGYATLAAALTVTVNAGADGLASSSTSLTNSAGTAHNGTATLLTLTETGQTIYLFTEDGLIVGRAGDNAGAAASGTVAFAIGIDGDDIDVVQYAALVHGNTSSHDDSVALGDFAYVTVSATDGDNDIATSTSATSLQIAFEDDGPEISDFTTGIIPQGEVGTVFGTFAFDYGSDDFGGFQITGPDLGDGVSYSTTDLFDGSLNLIGKSITGTTTGPTPTDLFTLSIYSNGTYEYELLTPNVVDNQEIPITGLASGKQDFIQTPDGVLEFSGVDLNSSTQGFGVSDQFMDASGEQFVVEVHSGPPTIGSGNNDPVNDDPTGTNIDFVSSIEFGVQQVGGDGARVTLTVLNTVTLQNTSVFIDVDDVADVIKIDPGFDFNQITFASSQIPGTTLGNNDQIRITTVTLEKTIIPPEQPLDFLITALDGDNDPSQEQTLTIYQVNGTVDGSGTVTGYVIDGDLGGVTDDVLAGSLLPDTMDGKDGFDLVDYSDDTTGVTVDLNSGTGSGGSAAGDTYLNIEGALGGSGNDTLTGDTSENLLVGNAGVDTLAGGLGGVDTLWGGELNGSGDGDVDTFVIDDATAADIIGDYETSVDEIDLTALLNGLPNGTDVEADGYVQVVQDGDDANVQIDADGGGDGYQTVVTLQNFDAGAETVRILFNETGGDQTTDV